MKLDGYMLVGLLINEYRGQGWVLEDGRWKMEEAAAAMSMLICYGLMQKSQASKLEVKVKVNMTPNTNRWSLLLD